AGDVNGDGFADIIVASGPGSGPHVRVFSGKDATPLQDFFTNDPAFTGGVFVAAGDVNGDGRADIITGAGAGDPPQVKVFDGATGALLTSFLAFDADFQGGVRVAAGDVNADGTPDIIVAAGPGGGPHVRIFDGKSSAQLADYFAFDAS